MRNIVANRLATGGQEWASIFKKFNSGTGMVAVADKSDVLYKTGYWASYNVPYFPEVFNASGLPALVEKFWDWFYYDKTPRALIFQRDHSERYGINGEANELTSYEMAKKYQMVAVNEPTWDQVPPFQWSTSPFRSLMHIVVT
ncbi:putative phospholipase B-like 2 [Xenopus laevis]|uniref:Phospholipase B-like n=1 Tax=Xenopus laevis TaxID=8355 RepID=A0A8J1M4G2_XENLA|nr:putative phospholipase B-like 2 [Xenopus laevis]XP_041436187.1 putative phospholipase B-like 2 [Xenopus laevis]